MTSLCFSDFGKKLTGDSGILRLMDDLGAPPPPGIKTYAFGGGNPAQIPQVESLYRAEMERILQEGRSFEDLIGRYDGPQGRAAFIEAVASYLSRTYGWNITPENIAVTNGSQSACFYLFNLLGGSCTASDGQTVRRKILFPLVPEYVGYADQGIEPGTFVGIPSRFEDCGGNTFKYFVDFDMLESYLASHRDVGAMCVSRPTNPTGNVLTDAEVRHMAALAGQYGIPLIVDNAYGLPWPHIIFNDGVTPYWDENVILSMSLSKIGLPSLRTGIIIARKEIVSALAKLNSIIALASGSLGQAVAERLIRSGSLVSCAASCVRPFYEEKNRKAQQLVHQYFSGCDYAVHKGEGSIFLWVLMRDLAVPTKELYRRLKERGVIVVPGEYFFFGQDAGIPPVEEHPHYSKCLRLNYARPDDELEEGIRLLAQIYKENCI